MDVRAIRTEEDYAWALGEIEAYFDREPIRGTPEAERFDVLAALIEAYEAHHWPVEAPDPVAAIKAVMQERGLKQADLALLLGSRSRASEILSLKRGLSVEAIRKLHVEWGIPAETLLRPYDLEGTETATSR